jgi:DeoR/GlpR family transcriptional regulator of sugar metabolism
MLVTLAASRRELLLARLAEGHSLMSSSLASEFGVSEDAIRRDLRALAEQRLCRRVYGGALPLSPSARPMAARVDEGRENKRALAWAALDLIQPSEFIFLDSSSTNLQLAHMLPLELDLTIATNSVDIAAALLLKRQPRLIMIGGVVNPTIGGCVDATALRAISEMNIDRGFVGVCAVSATFGAGAIDPADAAFKRALLAASQATVAMMSSDKLDSRAPHRIANLEDLDALVVEHDLSSRRTRQLMAAGATIVRAAAP